MSSPPNREIYALVVRGAGLGRKIGVPTANLKVSPRRVLRNGVFKVLASGKALGQARQGVCNVGVRPTVEASALRHVEVHIPGFSGNLYGKRLRVRFLAKIRDEKRFASLGALKAQIRRDINTLER